MCKQTIEPDWSGKCSICGASPVVTFSKENSHHSTSTEMCGVCYFGEASCIDPDEWGTVVTEVDDNE